MVKLDCKYCKIVNKKINYIYFFIVLNLSIQITNTELDDLQSSSNNNKGDVYSAVVDGSLCLQHPHNFLINL
jgi:hypothetical protein